jgi:hypothetical protein
MLLETAWLKAAYTRDKPLTPNIGVLMPINGTESGEDIDKKRPTVSNGWPVSTAFGRK